MTGTLRNILDVEVMLSNFDGRDRVSVSEFLGYASMSIEEAAFREGVEHVAETPPSETPDDKSNL